MKLRTSILVSLIAALALTLAPPASAEFDFEEFDVTFTDAEGQTVSQAGSHPFQMTTSLRLFPNDGSEPFETVKDILVRLLPGFVGNPSAVPTCETADFLTATQLITPEDGKPNISSCPGATALGVVSANLRPSKESTEEGVLHGAVYNLKPPPGVAAKLGFWLGGIPVTVEAGIEESPPNRLIAGPTNIAQVLEVVASELVLWGTPADAAHDPLRGRCLNPLKGTSLGKCPASLSEVPFLTLPRACEGPLETHYRIDSWQKPGFWIEGSTTTHDAVGNPLGMTGCGKLDFGPEVGVQPTTTSAESSSGLEVAIDVADEGLLNPEGLAQADIAATELRLPAGMTVNPSAAEGLGVCSKAQFEASSLTVKGCPDASKLGTLEADTPVLENHTLKGAFYLAQQDDPSTKAKGAENPFDSLLAAYLVIRDTELGVFVKLPAKIETDLSTGQIVTTVKDLPPYPLEAVKVHLRSGPRAPLITPPACGTYETEVILTPSFGQAPLTTTSSFQIDSGPGGSPCPQGGTLPFNPGFEAGSVNSAAGRFTPFAMRLTRADGEQDLTKFSATLPPGLTGKLAGLSKCPDAAIEAAKAKSGRSEQASPSCPASSRVGSVLAGAGVGAALTWAGGSLYLAGPYNGAPLSVVAIVPAVAGPFDVGTVITRVALDLNPTTAEVEVDGSRSDPIPHILQGIPLKVRDIRVFADRPQFTLNPTSCDPYATQAQIFGSGIDVFNAADDAPALRSARFQASSCASLGFKPKLAFKLKGGTKRGGHPALTATYVPRAGDANLESLLTRLPRSAFLDQAHIRTICTRVQFAANACPKAAQYGTIEATTPLLEAPLKGPVWLRSSNHNLPDLVFDLQGLVDVEVSTRIDSIKGGIRANIEGAPDAPITKVVLRMQGGRKGLIVNSRNLCSKPSKASAQLAGHNGRASSSKPVLKPNCRGKRKDKRK
jgi:hypothetical protein